MENALPTSYEQKLIVTCPDGVELVGDLLLPLTSEYRAFVQINSATGVRKEFYLPFAQQLASMGFVTYVYDYRGIGESKVGNLSSSSARISDWGRLDMTAVLDFGHKAFPTLPKFVIGHSIGGQLLGLMPNHYLLNGAVVVAASSGYWRLQPWSFALRSLQFFNLIVPVSTTLFGYVTAKALGIMEDLPAGVGLEWRKWCLSSNYLFDHIEPTHNHYPDIRYPIRSLLFADDPIANERSAEALMRHFTKALPEILRIKPSQVGGQSIGHFGFFSRRFRESLWSSITTFLEELTQLHTHQQSTNSKNSAFGKGLKT